MTEEMKGQHDQDHGDDHDLKQGKEDQQITRFEKGKGSGSIKPGQIRGAPPAEELGKIGAVVGGRTDVECIIGIEPLP